MKTAELRQKSKQELQNLLETAKVKLQQLRFDLASGKLKNVKDIKNTFQSIFPPLLVLDKLNLFS